MSHKTKRDSYGAITAGF